MRTHRRSTALLMLSLTACHTWRTSSVAPAELVAREPRIRVQLADGRRVELQHPVMAGDSVAGSVRGRRTAVDTQDVRAFAVRRGSAGKTVGLVLGLTGAVLVTAVIACADNCGPGFGGGGLGLGDWDWGY